MTAQHLSTVSDPSVMVLLPIRSFRAGKSRLEAALAPDERIALAASMASRVVRAAHELPVRVVTSDAEVAAWAVDQGAAAFDPAVDGLNQSVTVAVEAAAASADIVMIAHADLPDAIDLRPVAAAVAAGADVAIAPDRRHDGTNVMAITAPATHEFTFRYGPGSCGRHLHEAADLGLRATLVTAADLAFDLDDLGDLDEFQRRGNNQRGNNQQGSL